MLNLGRGMSTMVIGCLLVLPRAGVAQTSAPETASASVEAQKIAQLEAQVADAKSSADNTWMLVSSALVLLMTGPGLALFYGGLVRKKNILSVMMQSFAMMSIITVLWAVLTYSLAFDSGASFIGGLHHIFLRGVGLAPDPDYSATIPLQTFMIYQLMFAIITPALITGAFAERMRFSAMCVLLTLWSIFVYSPMAHMVWGKGGLSTPPAAVFPPWTSLEERSSTSPQAFPRWSAHYTSADGWVTPKSIWRPTPWCSASWEPACCGSAGSALMLGAPLLAAPSQQVPL